MRLDDAYEARKKGKYKEALALYRAVLTEMPDNAKAHEGMALCWLTLQDYKKASIAANQALAFDPSLVISHLVLMHTSHHQKRSKEVESELRKAIEIDSSSPYVIDAQGINLLWKNQFGEAANIFLKALEVSPDISFSRGVHINLGYLYWRERKFKLAAQEYKIANELMPSSKLAYSYWVAKLGWFYLIGFYLFLTIFYLMLLFLVAVITRNFPKMILIVFIVISGILAFRMYQRRKKG